MRIEESIVIERPPEQVFAFFNDRRNDTRWMETVESSEWLDQDAPTGLGRRGRMVIRAPRPAVFEDEVTEYEPDRRVGHRSVSRSMIMFTACYAEPVPGGTRASVVFEPERLPRWHVWMADSALRGSKRAAQLSGGPAAAQADPQI